MFLNIDSIHVSYGNIKALKGISLCVDKGEIVTLIGSNGAGKTTTMRAIMGLTPVSQGKIEFDGSDITNKDTQKIVQKGIGLSPEGRQVFPEMTTLKNLMLGGFTRTKEENEEELKVVHELFPRLKEREKQPAGTLSGGEQQMLAVARALMSRPKLLLLDEPSMGLAPLMVREIFSLIERIREMGTSVLLVEQNARMALKISDRGYVIETGTIAVEGRSSELLASPTVQKVYLGG